MADSATAPQGGPRRTPAERREKLAALARGEFGTPEQQRKAAELFRRDYGGDPVDVVAGAGRPPPAAAAAPPSAPPRPAAPSQEGTASDYGRAALSGAVEATSLGAVNPWSRLEEAERLDRINRRWSPGEAPEMQRRGREEVEREYRSAQEEAYSVSRNPQVSALANILNPLTIGTGIAAGVGRLARLLVPTLRVGGPTIAKTVAGAVPGAVGAGSEGTARALVAGESVPEALKQGAQAAAAPAVVGAMASRVSTGIRDPRRLEGRYVRAMEATKDYRKTKKFTDLPQGVAGAREAATVEGRGLGELQAGKRQAALDRLAADEAAIEGRNEPMDVAPVHQAVDASVRRFSNERPMRPDVVRVIEGEIKPNLSREVSVPIEPVKSRSSVLGAGGEPVERVTGFRQSGPAETAPIATPADLLAQRRLMRQKAAEGSPQTPENAPYRELRGILSDATHAAPGGVGEAFAAMDKRFSDDMAMLERGNELLFGKDDARAVTESVRAGDAAAARLSQAIGDTAAAGTRAKLLEDIRNLGPEYAAAVDRVEAKIAHEGTRFGPPRLFSHSGKWWLQPLLSNLTALSVRGIEPTARAVRSGLLVPPLRDPAAAFAAMSEEKRKRKGKQEGKRK